MNKLKNSDILGRFIVAAIIAYFLFKYNYEVSQMILAFEDAVIKVIGTVANSFEHTFDEAGILADLFLLVIAIILVILILIIEIVGGGLVWLLVKLNDLYILPFIIPLLVVYSKFSYSFVVAPLVWIGKAICFPITSAGKILKRIIALFVILPIGEVITWKSSSGSKLYKIGISLLFVFGFVAMMVGVLGITINIVKNERLVQKTDDFIANYVSPLFMGKDNIAYTVIQQQAIVKANTPFWTQTGIKLFKGDIVSFKATGFVKCIAPFKSGFAVNDPNGIKNAFSPAPYVTAAELPSEYRALGYTPSNYIFADEALNCLIGKVGVGEPFHIGVSLKYKVRQSGELLLGINQPWLKESWKNNKGKFDVNIVIKRKE